ncbi:ABC transporter permease [Paenibacillus tyrfis]|uniref:ABC transporter permease n=1 Tax=Paenibacillus tyrfis TaxID=1501230 RepID=UPI000B597F43|nr:ABC transporter permease [Paenibacillus tyrfis]
MFASVCSEWIKYRRTAIPWIAFLVPLAFMGIVLLYAYPYHGEKTADTLVQDMMDQAAQLWYGVWFPLGWGLLTGLSAQFEAASGNWLALRVREVSPAKLYGAKMIVLAIYTGLSTLWLFILLAVAGNLLGVPGAEPWWAVAAALLAGWIASLPLLFISLWLAEAFNWAVAVGFGTIGILIASLIGATSLGNGNWTFIPWSWPIKFTYMSYLSLTQSGESPFPATIYWNVLVSAIVLSMAITGISVKWFKDREVK